MNLFFGGREPASRVLVGAEAAAADRRGRRDRACHRLRRLAHRPRRSGGSSATTTNATTLPQVGPTAVSVTQLGTFTDKAGHPIYWAGPIPGTHYELTQTSKGSIYVRYLPQGVPIGTNARHTLVGSYPVDDASKVLQGLAKEDGEISFPAPGSGIAVYSKSSPTNVYLAYPDSNVQIEVFDPSPARARGLITSGQIAPVP